MDKNDYLGSFAEENVVFQTKVVKTTSVGGNYMKTLIFITANSLTADGVAALVTIPGSTFKALTVTADDYASNTTGLLQSWLVDLFANGSTFDAILCTVGNGTDAPTADDLAAVYDVIKPYAYHKTICIKADGTAPATNADVDPVLAKKLVDLCTVDKTVLSGAPLLPYSVFQVPTGTGDDPLYAAVKESFAFMVCHTDATRNGALYALGVALSDINGSGTPVGNPMCCRPASSNITQSDANGLNSKTIRTALNALNIVTLKPVGDNSGDIAGEGEQCLNGDFYAAEWIKAFVAYMTKVGVARLITKRNNFWKSEASYQSILGVLQNQLNRFGTNGSGRLKDLMLTAPAFANLPEAENNEIVIPNAWVATYIGVVDKVTITGTLYIEA